MVGMQTDDTLILVILAFLAAEEEKIQKADIRCEPKITLSPTQSLDFNGTKLTVDDGHVITVQQKGQGQKISTIKATGYAQASQIGFVIALVNEQADGNASPQLGYPRIPLVICTDSYLLYECLVKKRLMIDVIPLRKHTKEINEIRWINGEDAPAAAMTKSSPNKALERLVSTNELTVRVEGYVDRPT
ncbi:hypothetical protein UCDDA912_g00888 [Diaporthe ampelina]|uniref:Uncharacterized protein n=1 Tax=Diaporthe ampelina TaxID=1214573 RepID=A0A0G2FYD0_9PEZI|nr:hypothetical protein UCDDA912_g00888 [Diaporthe ampelina]